MQALNQNLANLRAELKQQKDIFSKSEEKINAVKGENLEMEAKLSNCVDYNNQLLERCLVSEKLCESMKSQNIELKRRYEDTQSALQELGREHQELQVRQRQQNIQRFKVKSSIFILRFKTTKKATISGLMIVKLPIVLNVKRRLQ